MIAQAYNLQNLEPPKPVDKIPTKESARVEKASPKIAKIKPGAKKDPVDLLIPDEELPVDPERLKKAIKIALIKNDNNPEKIDIQSIMREQVRIHKHISDFK